MGIKEDDENPSFLKNMVKPLIKMLFNKEATPEQEKAVSKEIFDENEEKAELYSV